MSYSRVPHVPGRERDLWYSTFEVQETERIPTGSWPRIKMVCTHWEENAAGERRLVERRSVWLDFDPSDDHKGADKGASPALLPENERE